MAAKMMPSSRQAAPRARAAFRPDAAASWPAGSIWDRCRTSSPTHARVLLLEGADTYIANILKRPYAIVRRRRGSASRGVIAGSVDYSDRALMGDLRHRIRQAGGTRSRPNPA